MEDFLGDWGYLGIFLGLIATGLGVPMPEELPVVMGGALTSSHPDVYWWIMLPVCIAGVIVGDSCLYTIGRVWGPRLVQYKWVQKRLLPPDRLAQIEANFDKYGVKILLFARLTPGIRAPVFLTAGLTRLSVYKFLIADGLYAIPGVSLLFFLGYWFAESMVGFVKGPLEQAKSIAVVLVVVIVIGYLVYRALRKPTVTGDPKEIPPLVEQVTHTLGHMTSKIIHPMSGQHTHGADRQSDSGADKDGQQTAHPPTVVEQPRTPQSRP